MVLGRSTPSHPTLVPDTPITQKGGPHLNGESACTNHFTTRSPPPSLASEDSNAYLQFAE